jgi:hypothetical protein
MADRKRKRKSSAARGSRPNAPAAPAPTEPEAARPASGAEMMKRGYARAEEKNQAVRDSLEPIQPGERPPVLIAAVVWLAVIAVLMVYNAVRPDDLSDGSRVGNLAMVVLIVIAAVGTLRLRYWAILGTQTLLALTLVSLILFALVIENVLLVLLGVLCAVVTGYLFYKMVKVMARVQKTAMLERDGGRPR